MGELFRQEQPAAALTFTGERFTSTETGAIEIEHLHRYYLARCLCRGKDVLDIACGEGYGAALLAQTARSVTGIDVAEDAISHAARSYARENLAFRCGSGTALPLAEASVDVVVSFETIEHFYDHALFISEVRRVLRPGGLLVLSSPDRDVYSPPNSGSNPFHVHELTRREFENLLRPNFLHCCVLGQRAFLGSAIMVDETAPRTDLPLVFENRGEAQVEGSGGMARATYLIALASDSPLTSIRDSLFVYRGDVNNVCRTLPGAASDGIATLEHRLRWAEQERGTIRAELRNARDVLTVTQHELQQNYRRVVDLDTTLQTERASARAREIALHRAYARHVLRGRGSGLRQALRDSVLRRWRERAAIRLLAASPLFDRDWYVAKNADVQGSQVDPVKHYLRFGALEGRDPGPNFCTLHYVSAYPDVIASGLNPLQHFELFGRAEGRLPLPERVAPQALAAGNSGGEAAQILFISGEPKTPGHIYRVERMVDAARRAGANAIVATVGDANKSDTVLAQSGIVVFWRCEWTPVTESIFWRVHGHGGIVVFDVDDLMFEPDFATHAIIDGIRTQNYAIKEVRRLFSRVQQMMRVADFCTGPTTAMIARFHRRDKPTFILPNTFDEGSWRAARDGVRLRRVSNGDGLMRIGYAGGSRTHQKDFAIVANVVARVLREDKNRRLVLFKNGPYVTIDIEEYPALHERQDQIEWREVVPVRELPRELARFDINLAPLEVGNPFCEAKSELKYFEAAIASVPTICSPTLAFREAVRQGETGILAETEEEWYDAINLLLGNARRRAAMAQAAYYDVLWRYGPDGLTELFASFTDQLLRPGWPAAIAFEREIRHRHGMPRPLPEIPESEVLVHIDTLKNADVTVVIPLYNYAHYVLEALESVRDQTSENLHLVVVDDCSTDNSVEVVRSWLAINAARFGRALLIRNRQNQGLGLTRNAGFAAAETRYVLTLDPDNKLMPECTERCRDALDKTMAAFVYPSLQRFGDEDYVFSHRPWNPAILKPGNYIDATALVKTSAWARVGGYKNMPLGWEDYDLWCRMAELGMWGEHLDRVLALYRVHGKSMLQTTTQPRENKRILLEEMRQAHPWILHGIDADSTEPGGLIQPLPAEP